MLTLLCLCPWILALQAATARVVEVRWPDGSLRSSTEVETAAAGEVASGSYRSWYEGGQPESSGVFAHGLKTGEWETWHRNGARASKGRYVKDRRSGAWTFWNEAGEKDPVESGSYEFRETRYEKGGTRSAGYERDGVRHGPWTFSWPDGTTQFQGAFRNGLRAGEWIFTHQDGTPAWFVLSGHYDGERDAQLTRERWRALVAEARNEHPARPVSATVSVADTSFPKAGDAQRACELANALSSIDPSDPRRIEHSNAIVRALLAIAHGHSYGWREGTSEGDAEYRGEAARSWVSLCALKAGDPFFWHVDMLEEQGRTDAQSPLLCTQALSDVIDARPEPKSAPSKAGAVGKSVQASLDASLDWLVAHQSTDGAWPAGTLALACARHGSEPCPDCQVMKECTVGMTTLALLALASGSGDPTRGPRADALARGVAWLLAHQDESSGLIRYVPPAAFQITYANFELQAQSVATTVLCRCLRYRACPPLERGARAALAFVAKAQNPYRGWRYSFVPDGDTDTLSTTWALFALDAARGAKLEVDPNAFAGAMNWLEDMTDPATGRCGYNEIGGLPVRYQRMNESFSAQKSEAPSAAALCCRVLAGQSLTSSPLVSKHADLLAARPPVWDDSTDCDFVYWWLGTRALSYVGGARWDKWNACLNRELLDHQIVSGGRRGSWDPVDAWSFAGGRVYATAVGALCLEASTQRLAPSDGAAK